jgi:hypothetical protein
MWLNLTKDDRHYLLQTNKQTNKQNSFLKH